MADEKYIDQMQWLEQARTDWIDRMERRFKADLSTPYWILKDCSVCKKQFNFRREYANNPKRSCVKCCKGRYNPGGE
jgi:hypothetical protein